MHYLNGTEAREGDHVITRDFRGNIRTGVISNLNPGADTCNCDVSIIHPGGVSVNTCQTVGSMCLAADALAALEAQTAQANAIRTATSDASTPVMSS